MNGTANGAAKNEVEIDQAALAAEAASIPMPDAAPPAEGAAPDASAGASEQPQRTPQEFAAGAEPLVLGVLAGLHGIVAPNWTVAPEKMLALTKASALALAYWFPHEIPPKYVALMMVGGSLYAIAQDNRDQKTGAYKPLHAPPLKPADDAAAAS